MQPIFINNSKIPVWIGKITRMNIWAFSFGFWVWSKGEIQEITKRHETIHFRQQLELLFIFQWLLYGLFWLIGLIIYGNSKDAYRNNPFEKEAYENQIDKDYLDNRRFCSWWKYMWWYNKSFNIKEKLIMYGIFVAVFVIIIFLAVWYWGTA